MKKGLKYFGVGIKSIAFATFWLTIFAIPVLIVGGTIISTVMHSLKYDWTTTGIVLTSIGGVLTILSLSTLLGYLVENHEPNEYMWWT